MWPTNWFTAVWFRVINKAFIDGRSVDMVLTDDPFIQAVGPQVDLMTTNTPASCPNDFLPVYQTIFIEHMQDQENLMMNAFGPPPQDPVRSWSEAPDCYAESILGDPEDGMRGEKRKLDRLVELEDELKREMEAKNEIVEDDRGDVDVLGPRPFKRLRL
ncbi:hypothetical protein FRB99_001896 [Tulasnella sp. 403]|nr:hypothetical protein FRB99_001896 [Tulasnella sp. 403]